MLFRPLAAAAILALSFTAAQAGSATSTDVAYGDLNLSQPSDAKVLAARLQDAAKTVCNAANPDLRPAELQSCMDEAISMAMAKIENHFTDQVHARLVTVRQSLSNP